MDRDCLAYFRLKKAIHDEYKKNFRNWERSLRAEYVCKMIDKINEWELEDYWKNLPKSLRNPYTN